MLEARKLGLWRGDRCLFDDLSFQVEPGQIVLVRGENGTGKTTLLRVLCGLTRPEQGQVHWNGNNIEENRECYGSQLAYWGHLGGLKHDLSVLQNLQFICRLNGLDMAALPHLLESLSLTRCIDLPVRQLSAGQQRRTGLAGLLLSRASLWIMDEPFTNMDDNGREYLQQRIQEHLDQQGMVVVAAHHELALPESVVKRVMLGLS